MSKSPPHISGSGHFMERLRAVGGIRSLHVRDTHMYTFPFIRNVLGAIDLRWIMGIKEIADVL